LLQLDAPVSENRSKGYFKNTPVLMLLAKKQRMRAILHFKAYKMGLNIKQGDYLLLSLEIFRRVKNRSLNRRAIWLEKASRWPVYHSMKNEKQAASEHAVVWGEIEI